MRSWRYQPLDFVLCLRDFSTIRAITCWFADGLPPYPYMGCRRKRRGRARGDGRLFATRFSDAIAGRAVSTGSVTARGRVIVMVATNRRIVRWQQMEETQLRSPDARRWYRVDLSRSTRGSAWRAHDVGCDGRSGPHRPLAGEPGLIAYECPSCGYVNESVSAPRRRPSAGSTRPFSPVASAIFVDQLSIRLHRPTDLRPG